MNPFAALVDPLADRPGTPQAATPRAAPIPRRECVTPWKLTGTEVTVLRTLAEVGCGKTAAKTLGVSNKTIEAHESAIRKKMGVGNRVLAILHWDRFIRSQGAQA